MTRLAETLGWALVCIGLFWWGPACVAGEAVPQTISKLRKERDRLTNKWGDVLRANKIAQATTTMERILQLERELLVRAEQASPVDAATVAAFRFRMFKDLDWLAKTYEGAGNLTAAVATRREVLSLVVKIRGKDDWQTTDARLAVEHLELLHKLSPEQRQQLANAEQLPAHLLHLEVCRSQMTAVSALRKAMDIRKAVLGKKNLDYAQNLDMLAFVYQMRGDDAKEEALSSSGSGDQENGIGRKAP